MGSGSHSSTAETTTATTIKIDVVNGGGSNQYALTHE